MAVSPRPSMTLCLLTMSALAALAAGCAGTPQHESTLASPPAASPAASTAGAPASASDLVRTADFTAKAERDGWHAMVRDGNVVYCKEYIPMNSMIPRRTCLAKTAVKMQMLAEERQRESMQHAGGASCPTGTSCQ
jgi:hypothetical protein